MRGNVRGQKSIWAAGELAEVGIYSTSAYCSLLVKAIRIGWPAGCEEAARRLPKRVWLSTARAQIWEDIWPAREELSDLEAAIAAGDWAAVCSYDTHHTLPGVTEAFMRRLEDPDVKRKWPRGLIPPPPPRARYCAVVWQEMVDTIPAGRRRPVCIEPYREMPPAVLDMHTKEGRGKETILSGTLAQHCRIAEYVQRHGWEALTAAVFAGVTDPKDLP